MATHPTTRVQKNYEYRGDRPRTYPWGSEPSPGQHISLVFYGGDLQGITHRLDYISSLGVNALYLTPVFTAYSNHKYDVTDYDHVDPHFGGDAALVALRQALDERRMRYILDIVPNHCGYWHPWFQTAYHDPTSLEAGFFTFNPHPEGYLSWLGVWTLPKLNYQSQELDLSLQKNFPITESKRVEFRAEFINFTNTPILAGPGAWLGGGLGKVQGSQGPRNIHFGLKIYY